MLLFLVCRLLGIHSALSTRTERAQRTLKPKNSPVHIQTFPPSDINIQAPESLHPLTRKWVSLNIKFAAEPTCRLCAACTPRLSRDILIFKQTILKLLTKVNVNGNHFGEHAKAKNTRDCARDPPFVPHTGESNFSKGGGTVVFRERITRPVSGQFNGLSVSISDLGVRPGIKRIFSGSCAPNQISNFRRPGVTSFHRNRVELRGKGVYRVMPGLIILRV